MTIIQAFVYGIIQGLTEFIPVSSSGHLITIPSLLGWKLQSLAFDVVLHLGTTLALVMFFWKDLIRIILKERKLGYFILVGSIPAGVAGIFLNDMVEDSFRGVAYVAMFFLLGSAIMYLGESLKNWEAEKELTFSKSIIIGIFQSLAVLPGISRSGASISGGMMLGLSKEKATKFSFLLSLPIFIGAGFYKIYTNIDHLVSDVSTPILLIGFFTSFFVGILAIRFMLKFVKTNTLYVFIIYRILFSIYLLLTV